MIRAEFQDESVKPRPRQTQVLRLMGIAPSSWHREPRTTERKRPGPAPKALAPEIVTAVVEMAIANPWYGYKRIAVMCRRAGQVVKDREAYVAMKDHGLLQKRKTRRAETHQAAKLFELLPQKPNDLWQMDVTYLHIAGYGWYYAVTELAREEAERLHGPLAKRPFLVTDNGSSFIAEQYSHVRIQYRTPQQLGLLERVHATLKTEEVYWRLYDRSSAACP